MIVISVSTNYDDLLNIVIPQNSKFFDKWYIITSEDDEKTIQVIHKYNHPNIEIVYFDFYADNKSFNKGGAIGYVQSNVIPNNYAGDVLLLDSDIYLPDNFTELVNNIETKENILYGTNKRYDYYSHDHFVNNIVDYDYPGSRCFFGYFQLYKYNKDFLYRDSWNCAGCDLEFMHFFSSKITIPNMNVSHLGKGGVHWNKRTNHDDFVPLQK
jgi:hypothetical protein